jgi:hypothetical protein
MMLTDCRFWTERLTTTGSGTSALVPRGPVAKTTLSLPSVTAPPTRTRRSFSSVRRSFTRAHNCMRRTRSHSRKGAATLTSYSLPTAPRCSSKTGRESETKLRERERLRETGARSRVRTAQPRCDILVHTHTWVEYIEKMCLPGVTCANSQEHKSFLITTMHAEVHVAPPPTRSRKCP